MLRYYFIYLPSSQIIIKDISLKKLFLLITVVLLSQSIQASEVLAIVNGHKITTEVAPKNFDTLQESQKEKIRNKLIEKYLAANYALHTDIVNDAQYKKVLKHILSHSAGKMIGQNLVLAIKEPSGYTKEQLFSKKGLLAFDFLLERKMKTMQPDEKLLRQYYDENKFKYDTPAMIELSSIIVEDKKEANKIEKELQGKDGDYHLFSTLAKKYSKAPEASNGGYMGTIVKANLNSEIAQYISPLKRGEHTKPIKTLFGYEIYYLINSVPAVNTTYDMVQERVKDDYLHKAVKKWAFDTIKELKKSAKIEIIK